MVNGHNIITSNNNNIFYYIFSIVLFAVHCRQRRVDQKAHSKPSTSANTYWQIEKESEPLSGMICILKSLANGNISPL